MRKYEETAITEDRTTTATTKRLKGYDARFGTDPEEIYIELRMGSPAYIHVKEGDYLQEGDAFHRDQLGIDSPILDTWEVIDITPESVVGRSLASGEEIAWDREEIETGLAVGTYSTNLTDFEWVSVYQVGSWQDYDEEAEGTGLRYAGRPYVSVVAYGDNGLKYGRRYRFVEPGSTELYLWKQDEPAGGFREEIEKRLDDRVGHALESEGYRVVPEPKLEA